MANDGNQDDDLYNSKTDTICSLCDNGGGLVSCDDRCLRSFHPTRLSGVDSHCTSLRLSRAELARDKYTCGNCLAKKHQCFACGELGSSDNVAGITEVVQCIAPACGRFYHSRCIATLLFPNNGNQASKYDTLFAKGGLFTCPVHKCVVCGERENPQDRNLQLATCRRCPTSYHRKCLPNQIAESLNVVDPHINHLVRAWEDLLPKNRILIYCMRHEIHERLGTPRRNHIKFP